MGIEYQFRVTRIVLGVYLLYHFMEITPYAEELIGNDMLYNYKDGPTYAIFPNILNHINATIFMIVMIITTIHFILSQGTAKLSALILWYGWAAIVNRNLLISNPGIPYIGFILLLFACELDNNNFRQNLLCLAWFFMGLGYTISGIHKLGCPSWLDGTALLHVLNCPLVRDNALRTWVLQLPPIFLKLGTWFSLILEITSLPLGLFCHTRFIFWLLYLGFHLGIIMLINFADLTLGVFMIHVLTFDHNWLKFSKKI